MDFLLFSLVFLLLWLVGVTLVVAWVLKKVMPEIRREMDRQGLNEIQQQMIITKAVFPPKFHK
jgi:flagellar biogenesis protein FliO